MQEYHHRHLLLMQEVVDLTDHAEVAEVTTVEAEEVVTTEVVTTEAHVLQEESSTNIIFKKRESIYGLSFFILVHLYAIFRKINVIIQYESHEKIIPISICRVVFYPGNCTTSA
jgi:hypothetical protein